MFEKANNSQIILFDLHVFPVACIIGKIYLHCTVLLQSSVLLVLQREPLKIICRPLCRKGATLRKEVQKYLTIIAISSPSTSTYVFCSPSLFLPEWDSGFVLQCFFCLYHYCCRNKVKKQRKTAGKNIKLLVSEQGSGLHFLICTPQLCLYIVILLIYGKNFLPEWWFSFSTHFGVFVVIKKVST